MCVDRYSVCAGRNAMCVNRYYLYSNITAMLLRQRRSGIYPHPITPDLLTQVNNPFLITTLCPTLG